MILDKSFEVDRFSLVKSEAGAEIYLIPTVVQPAGTSIDIEVVDSLDDMDIKVGLASRREESGSYSRVGYLVRTRERVINLGTGLFIVRNSWYSTSKLAKPISNEDISLRIKLEGLVSYHIPNKLAIFTAPSLSTKLHEYLTMI